MEGSSCLIQVQEDWGDRICWVGRWCLLHLVFLQGHANGAVAIPDKVAWGMPESPLDPPSRFPFRRDWPCNLLLAVILMSMTCWGLPPLRVGSPSSHGSRWPLTRWMGSQNISCTWGQAYNALSIGDWWLCPHFDPPSCTRGSGSPHWSGIVHLDHVCPSNPLPLGLWWGYGSKEF